MAKQKEIWPGILFTIVIMLVLLAIIGPFLIDNILRVSIETAIKKQLNVGVSIAKVHLNIASGSIAITGLKINNPPGYEYEQILKAASINIKADVNSLTSGTIKIKQANLNDIAIVIEQKGLTSNLNDILQSMPKKPKTVAEETGKKTKNVHVASVDIQNIDVTAKLLPIPGKLDSVQLTIPHLHISNIGTDKKTTLAEVVGRIFTEIANAIATEGAGVMPGELLGPIQKNISKTGEEILKTGKDIEKEVKDAADQFKGLFKRKKD